MGCLKRNPTCQFYLMNDTETVFSRWSQFLCEKMTTNLIMSGLYLDHTWPLSSLGCSSRSLWCGHRWSCSGSHRSGGIHTRTCPGDTLHRTKSKKNLMRVWSSWSAAPQESNPTRSCPWAAGGNVSPASDLLEMLLRGASSSSVCRRERSCAQMCIHASPAMPPRQCSEESREKKKKAKKDKLLEIRRRWRNGQGVNKEPEISDPRAWKISLSCRWSQTPGWCPVVWKVCWCKTA